MCQSHDHHDNTRCFLRLNKFNVPFFSQRIISSQFVFNKNCIKYNRKIPGFFNINIRRYEGQNFLVSFFFPFVNFFFFLCCLLRGKWKVYEWWPICCHHTFHIIIDRMRENTAKIPCFWFNLMIHNFVVNKSPSIKRNLLVNFFCSLYAYCVCVCILPSESNARLYYACKNVVYKLSGQSSHRSAGKQRKYRNTQQS